MSTLTRFSYFVIVCAATLNILSGKLFADDPRYSNPLAVGGIEGTWQTHVDVEVAFERLKGTGNTAVIPGEELEIRASLIVDKERLSIYYIRTSQASGLFSEPIEFLLTGKDDQKLIFDAVNAQKQRIVFDGSSSSMVKTEYVEGPMASNGVVKIETKYSFITAIVPKQDRELVKKKKGALTEATNEVAVQKNVVPVRVRTFALPFVRRDLKIEFPQVNLNVPVVANSSTKQSIFLVGKGTSAGKLPYPLKEDMTILSCLDDAGLGGVPDLQIELIREGRFPERNPELTKRLFANDQLILWMEEGPEIDTSKIFSFRPFNYGAN